MIDWIIQVFKELESDTPKTLFLAVDLIDRYLSRKHLE